MRDIKVEIIDNKENIMQGRFPCVALYSYGTFKVLTDLGHVSLSASLDDIQDIKKLALRDKGSLFIKIKNNNVYVVDEQLKEEE